MWQQSEENSNTPKIREEWERRKIKYIMYRIANSGRERRDKHIHQNTKQ